MGYFDYLKWRLNQIGKGGRNRDEKELERSKAQGKVKKKTTDQSRASSSRRQLPEELF